MTTRRPQDQFTPKQLADAKEAIRAAIKAQGEDPSDYNPTDILVAAWHLLKERSK